MRLALLKLSWLLASVIAGGCIAPIDANDGDDETDVVRPDLSPESVSSPSIAVTASPDAFASIKTWIGTSNTITVSDATTIEQDAVTVNVPAGAKVSYQFSEELGTFTFAKPLPTVKASVLGFQVSPSLSVVTLRPTGDGAAKTSLGTYRFRWLAEDEESGTAAAPEKLPEVWCYGAENCPPCEKAKKDFEAGAKLLGFTPVWKTEPAPNWMPTSRPAFWWAIDRDQPSQENVVNTRRRNGYSTLKDFIETWHASRVQPKKFSRFFEVGQADSLARPDHNIGSRSVAQWSINGDFTPGRSTLLSHLSNDGGCTTEITTDTKHASQPTQN